MDFEVEADYEGSKEFFTAYEDRTQAEELGGRRSPAPGYVSVI